MDYYQGVVSEYLRADRSLFINTECCIQLNKSTNPDMSGPHWYCDALTICLREKTVYLCEVSYSQKLDSLRKRLVSWNEHWMGIRHALWRDCGIPLKWPARPWLFIPSSAIAAAVAALARLPKGHDEYSHMPNAKITPLEDVVPWSYCSWNRVGEKDKPDSVPESMK